MLFIHVLIILRYQRNCDAYIFINGIETFHNLYFKGEYR